MRFEYGRTTGYGSATSEQAIGAGASTVSVTAAIGCGRAPGTRYEYRAVATSAAGITRGANRSFTTPRVPTAVTMAASTLRPVWGSGVTVTGRVSGIGRTPMALERQDFPFTGPFVGIATTTASSSGTYSLTAPLFMTARLRVVTRTAVVAASPVTTASVAVKVGLKTRRLQGRRYRLEGAIWPALPERPDRFSASRAAVAGAP